MKITRHVSAVMAALVLARCLSVMATDITMYSDKAENLIGYRWALKNKRNLLKHIENPLTVNVHGKSLMKWNGKSKSKNKQFYWI